MKGVLDGRVPPRMLFGVEDDDEDEDADYVYSWIPWFCQLDGHEFLAEVDEEYIRDRFNLFGLKPQVANFEKALSTILNGEPGQGTAADAWDDGSQLYSDARDLYGLIHSRFILSPRGLAVMKEKFLRGSFGQCPRVLCDRQNCLPAGLTDQLEECQVRLYCPKCEEVYEVPRKLEYIVDGAFFGTSFPHIFLQTYPGLVPLDPPVPYVPKVFGFRVHGKKSIIQLKCEMGEFGSSLIPPDKQVAQNGLLASPGARSSRIPGPGCGGSCPPGPPNPERAECAASHVAVGSDQDQADSKDGKGGSAHQPVEQSSQGVLFAGGVSMQQDHSPKWGVQRNGNETGTASPNREVIYHNSMRIPYQ